MKTILGVVAAAAALLLALPAAARSGPARPVAYVVLGADGARIARALTTAPDCPSLSLDGRIAPMTVRAAAGTSPLRPTRSSPADSKPSVFAESVCEAVIPATVRRARLLAHGGASATPLPLPPARITRIVVLGDTGCRLKIGSGTAPGVYQACNRPDRYPFARIAASAAAWKPQLIIHVGDYHYRENACPADKPDCAGSAWGYGSDAWAADFFAPGAPLLGAAPLALVRGNHESCNRAGQGWMRYFDAEPFTAARSCDDPANDAAADYSAPFAVPLGRGDQLILFDSSNAPFATLPSGDLRLTRYHDDFVSMQALAARAPRSILVDHHPLLNLAVYPDATGKDAPAGGNAGLQQVFGPLSPTYAPKGVQLIVSGHVHLWEAVGFSGDFPAQIVAGFSGTDEDIMPLTATPPAGFEPAPGAAIKALSSWVDGFGFMTMTRLGADRWRIEVRDAGGKVVNTCALNGSALTCRLAQVPRHG
jgi:hypothetical protein